MKLLLTMNVPYIPSFNGASKANRVVLEELARRGHEVTVVAPALAKQNKLTRQELKQMLESEGTPVRQEGDRDRFTLNGVDVRAVVDPAKLRAELVATIEQGRLDAVIVSSEDASQTLLDAALGAARDRVVYLVHTTSFLPFGPGAFFPNAKRAKQVAGARAIVTVSKFVSSFLRECAGLESTPMYLPLYGSPPFSRFGRWDAGLVTIVNPCAVKGISIFLEVARRMPDVAFGAVPTWGTSDAERAALEQLPNVKVLQPSRDFDRILEQTRVLLVPSLLREAFGAVAVEAMLRGIPVLTSDAGGLPEAGLGAATVLPVRTIDRYEDKLDASYLPVPIVPEQDAAPWCEALRTLLGDRETYVRRAQQAWDAAHRFVAGLSLEPLERVLTELPNMPRREVADVAPAPEVPPGLPPGLTREQYAVLMLRLRKKSAAGGKGDR